MANSKGELTFKKGDILYVTDTMYNGHMGCWRACLVNEEDAQKREIGMVPSRMKYVKQLTAKIDFVPGEGTPANRGWVYATKGLKP